jgi:hypothetical protein
MLLDYDLKHEGLHGGISNEGKCSFMAEGAPTTFELGRRRRVMGNFRGMVPVEVSFRGIC